MNFECDSAKEDQMSTSWTVAAAAGLAMLRGRWQIGVVITESAGVQDLRTAAHAGVVIVSLKGFHFQPAWRFSS